MAGDTPGAARHAQRRAAARKKLLAPNVRSSEVYYRSDQVSVLGGAGQGITTPPQREQDKSAEKYYAEGGSDRAKLAKMRKKQLSVGSVKMSTHITQKEQIRPVLEAALERIIGGEQRVLVTVPLGDVQLLNRTRAAIDLSVTRQDMTEEQARSIRLAYTTEAAGKTVVPPVKPLKPLELSSVVSAKTVVQPPEAPDKFEEQPSAADVLDKFLGEIGEDADAEDATEEPVPALEDVIAKNTTPEDDTDG